MRNNTISRTDIGSGSPFDLVKGDQEDKTALNLDKVAVDKPQPLPPTKPLKDEKPVALPNEVEDNEEEEVEELPSNAKVKIKTNVPKLLAERLKTDGQLPEDFEVTEKTTAKDVENAYRKFMSDKVRQEERSEAIEELKSEGYDEKVLKSAKKLHYGVTEQEIRLEEAYSMLGSIEFDSSHKDYEKSAKTMFQQYYLDKGLPAEEAQKNADRDFDDSEDVPALISNRQNYFANRAAEMEEAHKEQEKNAQIAQKAKRDQNINKVVEYLDKRIIDGVTYTQQEMETVKKALFEKSETIVDEQGVRRKVTPYFKKKYERERNDEQALKDIVDFVLGYDVKKISDKANRSARKKIVDDLNDLIEVDVEITNPKPNQKRDDGGGGIERKSL